MADISTCLINGKFTKTEQAELFGEDITLGPSLEAMARVDNALAKKLNMKRQAKLQMNVMGDVIGYYDNFVSKHKGTNKKLGWEAVNNFLSSSFRSRGGIVPIEAKAKAILGSTHAKLLDMMEAYKPEKLGFMRDKSGPRNMIRAIMGDTVKDADANAYAKMWKEVTGKLKERFNRAGGMVQDLDEWALPQHHDPIKVGKEDFQTWRSFIEGRLDHERIHKGMDKKPSPAEWDAILKDIYDSIRTNGGSRITPGSMGGSKLGNRYQQHRFLHFKNSDSWLEYQDKFGSPDTYATLMSHVHMISNNIALLENMGPNPNATFKYLTQLAERDYGKDGLGHTQAIWNNIKGMGYGDNVRLSDTIGAVRNWQIATKLGSALLSALPDTMFTGITAKYNGLSVTRSMARFVKALASGNNTKRLAARIGMTAEFALDHAASANRLSEVTGYGATARIADATIRASGLNHWTQAGKAAFQIEFAVTLAELAGKDFDGLNKGIRLAMERYGITAEDWAKIRKADMIDIGNEKMLDPTSLDNDMMAKVVGMFNEETRYAVPEPGAKVKAILNQGTQKGTIVGEMTRAASTFKSFPITYMSTHMARMLHGQGAISRSAYSASLIIGTTVLGTMAVQMKELSKGKEAIDWDQPALWGKGFVQGGSGTMLGDFLLNPSKGYGSIADDVMGPVFSDITMLSKLFLADGPKAVMGGKKEINDLLANAAKAGKKLTPGQLWYNKLVLDRAIFDQINKSVDKNWRKKERKKERDMKSDYNQKHWWRPGEIAPEF